MTKTLSFRERINAQLVLLAEAINAAPDDMRIISVSATCFDRWSAVQIEYESFLRCFAGREITILPPVRQGDKIYTTYRFHGCYHGSLATWDAVRIEQAAERIEPVKCILPLCSEAPTPAEAACEVSINELGEFVLTDGHGYQHVGPKHELEAALDRRDNLVRDNLVRDNLVIEDDGE